MGGPLAAAYLLSVGPAFKAAGNTLFYMPILDEGVAGICAPEITRLAQAAKAVTPAALAAQLGHFKAHYGVTLDTLDQVHVIGDGDLLRAVQSLRHELPFKEGATFKASVYGPMQCMMKGVCAQCLQWQIDPETGVRTKAVYACSWQHQPLEIIDTHNLDERLSQNHMQEQLTRLWYQYQSP